MADADPIQAHNGTQAAPHNAQGESAHPTDQASPDTKESPQAAEPAPKQAPEQLPAKATNKSLITEFPKVLAAIGGVLAAITALITALNGATWLKRETPAPIPPTATVTVTSSPLPTATDLPTATPAPPMPTEPQAAAEPTQPIISLMDDFSSGGWEVIETDEWSTAYVNGTYQMSLWVAQTDVWALPDNEYPFADFRIEVDVRQIEGGVDAYSGVVVRHDDVGYYVFVIADDSMYSVMRYNGELLETLADWQTSEAIRPDGAVNRIMVECLGDHMHLSVNGQPLLEVVDDTHSSGTIGLLVGTFDQDVIETQFDNLRLQVIDRL